jgi:DNA-binding transcriptional MerR regulator
MDEDTGYLKARELAERTGLQESDVKRFLRTYGEFFSSAKQGRNRVYPPETAELLKQIADLEACGTTPPTIKGILRGRCGCGGGAADPASMVPGSVAAAAGESLTLGALADIKALQETIGELREEMMALRGKVAEHEQKIIGHQQQIRLIRHDVDEGKNEALARRMEGKTVPFWNRLFGGKGG